MLIWRKTRAKVQTQPITDAAAANHRSLAEPPLLLFLHSIPVSKVKQKFNLFLVAQILPRFLFVLKTQIMTALS